MGNVWVRWGEDRLAERRAWDRPHSAHQAQAERVLATCQAVKWIDCPHWEERGRDKVSFPPLSQRVRTVIRSPCMAQKDRKNSPATMNTGAALGKAAPRGDVTEMHVAFWRSVPSSRPPLLRGVYLGEREGPIAKTSSSRLRVSREDLLQLLCLSGWRCWESGKEVTWDQTHNSRLYKPCWFKARGAQPTTEGADL